MARLVYAARQLLEQTGGEPVGGPDGLGAVRSVMVSASRSAALARDGRVAAVEVVRTALGQVALVDFVTDRRAELAHPFDLG